MSGSKHPSIQHGSELSLVIEYHYKYCDHLIVVIVQQNTVVVMVWLLSRSKDILLCTLIELIVIVHACQDYVLSGNLTVNV